MGRDAHARGERRTHRRNAHRRRCAAERRPRVRRRSSVLTTSLCLVAGPMKRDYSAVGLALLTILTTPAAALGQGSNGPTAPFWQQLLLASIGPVLGTGVLGVSASLIVQSFQDRRRAVQEAEQERQR